MLRALKFPMFSELAPMRVGAAQSRTAARADVPTSSMTVIATIPTAPSFLNAAQSNEIKLRGGGTNTTAGAAVAPRGGACVTNFTSARAARRAYNGPEHC